MSHTTDTRIQRAECAKQTLTNDIDIRVDEDGPMDVGGLALIDGGVGKVDIP